MSAPFRSLLNKIDCVHQECLLVERIGVAGVTVVIRCGLKEADRGIIASLDGVEKIFQIVLVVRSEVIRVPYDLYAGGTHVVRVCGRRVKLKRFDGRL